jgi:hypothetical protein
MACHASVMSFCFHAEFFYEGHTERVQQLKGDIQDMFARIRKLKRHLELHASKAK